MTRPFAIALLALLSLGVSTGAHAWRVGSWPLDGATGDRLQVDATSSVLSGRRASDPAPTWYLVVTPQGPRLAGAPAANCNATLWVTTSVEDTDGDGAIDPARGDRLWLHVAVTITAPVVKSWLVTLAVDARGEARWLWSADDQIAPGLGRLGVPPVIVRVRSAAADAAPRRLLLTGAGSPTGGAPPSSSLLAFDANSGASVPLSFAPGASLAGGVTPVDIDADGFVDQLYAADTRHRLWRITLGPGLTTARLPLQSELLASLGDGVDANATLLHAPDVVAERGPDGALRLGVTLGTSDLPLRRAREHTLFHLRVPLRGLPPTPLTARALPMLGASDGDLADAGAPGFRMPLPGPLDAPVLTVDGRRLVSTAATSATPICRDGVVERAASTVTLFDWRDAPTARAATSRSLLAEHQAPLRADWARDPADPFGGHLECLIGDETLELCPAPPRLQRRYWLRSDAP